MTQSETPLLDSVLEPPAHITSLTDLLHEKDDTKALQYCLENFVDKSKLHSAKLAKNALLLLIAEIDEQINHQINEIIHHPALQKLEASWRGVWLLVKQADGCRSIKIKMLDIKWAEVVKDINKAMEFDQSQLFQKIYSDEYGTPGGEPYGALIGDYDISHRISKNHPYDDLSTLAGMAQIAAASFSPFITAASSELFGMDDFSGIGLPVPLEDVFSQNEYSKWHALRKTTDTRFIGLTLPKILMRRPYQKTMASYKGINFFEKKDSQGENNLWGNASYAFGCILIREFTDIGWFGHIRGAPRNHLSGGIFKELALDSHDTDANDIAYKPLTNVILTDATERKISELGFIPLCQGYLSPYSTFYNNQSIHKPKRYAALDVDTNSKISSMLQHVLCGARISHYIKLMVRDKIGSFTSPESCEDYIRKWLMQYTTGSEDLDWEEQAKYPLKDGYVRVKEHPNRPGSYLCVIHIQPHYQLDQMVSELELVTELASFRK
ncbi:type VI secretion system contractile sheath large subunit [Psychromonas sp. Urea-02u-13]|uniref:type VI secretion system contractile sheath large subunit n=1 Tax=Psychromonas sp. Urea-02u-13 TaxID=2058326 RepID=UPI0012FEEA86|nr:type VI secretion system contractile sheath large subunit [Psychromonas sp. Urea-02u-13]